MSIFSIGCKLQGSEEILRDEVSVVTEDNGAYYNTFTIVCGDSEQESCNNSFKYTSYGDDEFVIEQNRCELSVYIKPNKTPFDKSFKIVCTHANDSDVYLTIEIVQVGEPYSVSIKHKGNMILQQQLKTTVTKPFDNESYGSIYKYYEEVEFGVEVKGGSKKYRIEGIYRCHDEGNETKYYPFDNGFVYTKMDDKIVITNYGRPFLEENDYYVIKLCHEDYHEIKTDLKLKYTITPHSFADSDYYFPGTDISVDINGLLQTSAVYTLSRETMAGQTSQRHVPQYETVHDIILDNNNITQGQEYTINEPTRNVEIPFVVREDYGEVELPVRVKSSGSWCSVSTYDIDAEHRSLRIKITNAPIIVRKSNISIIVSDYPDTSFSFVLKNVPS